MNLQSKGVSRPQEPVEQGTSESTFPYKEKAVAFSRPPHSSVFVRPGTTDRSGVLTTWATVLSRGPRSPRRTPADSTMLSAHEAYRTPRRASSVRRRPDSGAPHPEGQPAGVQRLRGQHLRHAGGDEGWPHDVARDRAAVPHAHRDLRGPAPRRDHREPATRSTTPTRSIASARRDASAGRCTAFRSRSRTTSTRPTCRRPAARWRSRAGAAVRGDADEEPARRRRDHHREDRADRAGQLGRRRHARPTTTPFTATASTRTIRAAIRATTADGRPVLQTGGSSSGIGTAANFWAGNVGTETSGSILSPSNQNMLAGDQADGRPHQPLRRDPDHRRSGHARPDGEVRDRRRDHARRARERGARSQRSGDEDVHAAAGPRLHEVPAAPTA